MIVMMMMMMMMMMMICNAIVLCPLRLNYTQNLGIRTDQNIFENVSKYFGSYAWQVAMSRSNKAAFVLPCRDKVLLKQRCGHNIQHKVIFH
jgi:hypothetical protein